MDNMNSISKSYRPKQAAAFLGIGAATFWRWSKERPDFPKAMRLSARCTVFDADQLHAWRDAQHNNPSTPAPTKSTKEAHKDEMTRRIQAAMKAEVIRERNEMGIE